MTTIKYKQNNVPLFPKHQSAVSSPRDFKLRCERSREAQISNLALSRIYINDQLNTHKRALQTQAKNTLSQNIMGVLSSYQYAQIKIAAVGGKYLNKYRNQ